MKTLKPLITIGLLLLLLACEHDGLRGTYVGQKGSFLEKMTFISNNKVELTFFGSTTEATYTKEDNKVKINNAGENQIFTISDDGCLHGGGFIGTYCKE